MNPILSDEFLAKYSDYPENLKTEPAFARIKKNGDIETWKEICTRNVEHNVELGMYHLTTKEMDYPLDKVVMEAEVLFDNMFNLRQFPSVNALKNAGFPGTEPHQQFDCVFIKPKSWNDVSEIAYHILSGLDVSVLALPEEMHYFYPLKVNASVEHVSHMTKSKNRHTTFSRIRGVQHINIGKTYQDIQEGIAQFFFGLAYTSAEPHKVVIDYTNMEDEHIEPLKTFFGKVEEVLLRNEEASNGLHVYARPSHVFSVLSLFNVCAEQITGENRLLTYIADEKDMETLISTDKTTYVLSDGKNEDLLRTTLEYADIFRIHVLNKERMKRTHPTAKGVSADGASLLDSHTFANNVTVNVDAFVQQGEDESYFLDYSGLMQAQALAVRSAMRYNTNDEIYEQKRDNPISASIIGWADAIEKLGYDLNNEVALLELLAECARIESLKYAKTLRVNIPLTETTIRRDEQLALLAGVTPGMDYKESKTLAEHVERITTYQEVYSSQAVNILFDVKQESEDIQQETHELVDELVKAWGKLTTLYFDTPVDVRLEAEQR